MNVFPFIVFCTEIPTLTRRFQKGFPVKNMVTGLCHFVFLWRKDATEFNISHNELNILSMFAFTSTVYLFFYLFMRACVCMCLCMCVYVCVCEGRVGDITGLN